ncbi:uroporphyrinogen-III C-methyltransferase [Natronospirillum operosum]|uniref:uroporphyrinogen-III C-methyltransferase n=1 Tax=Natronospirillum operosum TaxID=2759953 RepID=UPI0014369582|nr:uroporphyrinogen-III C-methyltransferase [Natronospirillum operosum]
MSKDKTPEADKDQPTPAPAKAASPDAGPQTDNDGASSPPAADTPEQQPPPRRGGGLVALLLVLLLLTLGGAGAGGWWAWQQWELFQAEWVEVQATWADERSALDSQLESLQSEVSGRDDIMRVLQDDLDSTRDDLISLAERVSRESGPQEQDVMRLEIEYLLRTARHMSFLTGDLEQAENLLRQADRMLRDLNDLAYLPVREALAEDIQALRAVPRPDVDGIYFELAALASQAGQWEWWPDNRFEPAAERPELAEDALWYERLGRELRDLVNIRYRDDLGTERLTAPEFAQARTQFRLLMQQAQAALLQGRQSLYEASLEQAQEWVAQGAGQIPRAEELQAQLDTLRSVEVQVEVPVIDRGLTRLRALQLPADNGENDE